MTGRERARKVLIEWAIEHEYANEPGAPGWADELLDRLQSAGVIVLSESGRRD